MTHLWVKLSMLLMPHGWVMIYILNNILWITVSLTLLDIFGLNESCTGKNEKHQFFENQPVGKVVYVKLLFRNTDTFLYHNRVSIGE